jgi:diguanylate cyclase (GGDEF)-like protein
MSLSIPTLMAAIVLTSTVLALSIAAVAFRRSRALWIWAWALTAHTLAYILIVLRSQLGDFWTVSLGNALLATTFTLFSAGLLEFQQRRLPSWLTWVPVLVVAIVSVYWLDNSAVRSVLSSTVFVGQCLFILIALIGQHQKTAGRGQYLLMVGFFMLVIVIGYRLVEASSGRFESLSSQVAGPIQTATLLSSIVTLMLLASGMTLMNQERAEHELAQSREVLKQQNLALQGYAAELEDANQKLAELSISDGLTGLANRRRFDDVLAAESTRAQRSGQALAILMIDIDWFKKYNDLYGHQAGDVCLTQVASVLKSGARRPSDLVARYGGEEFTVITADTDVDKAEKLADALCRAVAALGIPHAQSLYGKVTISIGFAADVPDQESGGEDLLRRADTALYQAKDAGRNQIASG